MITSGLRFYSTNVRKFDSMETKQQQLYIATYRPGFMTEKENSNEKQMREILPLQLLNLIDISSIGKVHAEMKS